VEFSFLSPFEPRQKTALKAADLRKKTVGGVVLANTDSLHVEPPEDQDVYFLIECLPLEKVKLLQLYGR
jgi:hypothetical protein